jgi:NAD(P)H dehydrogenase (quinone)
VAGAGRRRRDHHGRTDLYGQPVGALQSLHDDTSHLQYAEKCWANKLAAGFINGASRDGDKQNSLVQLMTFAAQHQMHWVNLGLNYGNNRSVTNEEILNRDAYTLGVAAQANLDQGGDIAPPASDLRAAEPGPLTLRGGGRYRLVLGGGARSGDRAAGGLQGCRPA